MEAMSRLPSLERSSRLPLCGAEERSTFTGMDGGGLDFSSTTGTSASANNVPCANCALFYISEVFTPYQ